MFPEPFEVEVLLYVLQEQSLAVSAADETRF